VIPVESRALTALCLCFCTLRNNEIPRTDPLVQVDYAHVVDLDIGASKSDICAIRVVTISERGAAAETTAPKKSAKKPRKAAAGQKEMLMPIAGKKQAKETAAKKPAARQQRKSA
jgi:hypothetical protein